VGKGEGFKIALAPRQGQIRIAAQAVGIAAA
jgi:hypothetical protein